MKRGTADEEARDLRAIHSRNMRALELRPSIGQGTAVTQVTVRSGQTTCDIEDGGWRLTADVGRASGGQNGGPDPGVLARGALGACLAIGYVTFAAYMDVPIEAVQVTVESDYDARGMYGVAGSPPPGWRAVRYVVSVRSSAGEERVREMIEQADRCSPILDDITRPIRVERELRISAPVAEE